MPQKSLRNTYSAADLKDTLADIQALLAANGARKLMFEYSDSGTLESVAFALTWSGREIPVVIPANIERVALLLLDQAKQAWRAKQPFPKTIADFEE